MGIKLAFPDLCGARILVETYEPVRSSAAPLAGLCQGAVFRGSLLG